MTQLTFADAISKRDRAMSSVERHAGEEFREKARVRILELLARVYPHGLSAETLSDSCKNGGIVPHDDRAFGPVFMALSRERVIEKAGFCKRRKGHGTAGGNVWKLRCLSEEAAA